MVEAGHIKSTCIYHKVPSLQSALLDAYGQQFSTITLEIFSTSYISKSPIILSCRHGSIGVEMGARGFMAPPNGKISHRGNFP